MKRLFGNLIKKNSGSYYCDMIQYVHQINPLEQILNTLKTGKKEKEIEKKTLGRKICLRDSIMA